VTKPNCDQVVSEQAPLSPPSVVSVIVPCFNLAHLLADAIESILAQTDQHFELLVVDDGSTDKCEAVAARYPTVRYLRQENRGLAAARNAGLTASVGDLVVFVDADDRLVPRALEIGRQTLVAHPELAFVSGHFRYIGADGRPHPTITQPCPSGDSYAALLRTNYIRMHATVMYRRAALTAIGAFDQGLRACEDYELYLRIAREHPIACHHHIVAEYRLRSGSMSEDPALMLRSVLKVLRAERAHLPPQPSYRAAYREGRRFWRGLYAERLVRRMRHAEDAGDWSTVAQCLPTLGHHDPRALLGYAGAAMGRLARRAGARLLPPGLHARLPATLHPPGYRPPVGRVQLGHLRRTRPISREFGFDRGLPIDRYYIERFLAGYAEDIHGRVLEVTDDAYTRRFGGARVTQSDVLKTRATPAATIVADLTCPDMFPAACFDCVILTQTLHLIYDVRAALRTVWHILRPGGVALVTAPGISQIADRNWRDSWFWGFTSQSIGRLFREVFPPAHVTVRSHGNVLATIAFLEGLAVAELTEEELDAIDHDYQLLLTVRAVRPVEAA